MLGPLIWTGSRERFSLTWDGILWPRVGICTLIAHGTGRCRCWRGSWKFTNIWALAIYFTYQVTNHGNLLHQVDSDIRSCCWLPVLAYSCLEECPHWHRDSFLEQKSEGKDRSLLGHWFPLYLFTVTLTSPLLLMYIGVSMTIHFTRSAHPGVVKDPS